MSDFASTQLKPALLENLSSLGYQQMTPVQAESLPPIIDGQDVIAQAKTGSGKTAAFGLGLLHHLNVKRFRIQALVLCPTRELADQVAKELRKLARAIHNIKILTLCGGMPIGPQIGSLAHGAHIVVGTPGRVQDHLRKRTLSLDHVQTLVLDEADRMLEMGFEEALTAITTLCPKQRQTLLFSATFPKQIQSMAADIMRKPVMVKVEEQHDHSSIRQHFYEVRDNDQRTQAVRLLLHKHNPESTVVFCATKLQTQEVADELNREGLSALALHGDLEQRERDQALVRFANKSVAILVATDVAARGLDVENLDAVINFHLARDPEVHVHRVGRTGRAGNSGLAFSLVSPKDAPKLVRLEEYLEQEFETRALPTTAMFNRPFTPAAMATLQIAGGKKQKVRPGDILGALTGKSGQASGAAISGKQVGKINVFDNQAYVAVHRSIAKQALSKLSNGKLKGRNFRVRQLRD